MKSFEIHPRLLKGGIVLARISGCHVLLKNEASFPWFLVVPETEEGVEDLHQLTSGRFSEVMAVVRFVSQFVETHFQPTKLNVACIGNQVRQMHVHIIARSECDPLWPGSVWGGEYEKKTYDEKSIAAISDAFHSFPGLEVV